MLEGRFFERGLLQERTRSELREQRRRTEEKCPRSWWKVGLRKVVTSEGVHKAQHTEGIAGGWSSRPCCWRYRHIDVYHVCWEDG